MKRIFFLLGVFLIWASPARATYPTFDATNWIDNAITKVQTTIASTEAVQQTVHLLAQLKELQSLYENAQKAYKNIGDHVDKLKALKDKDWKSALLGGDITWDNLGKTMRKWDVKRDESSPLARLNDGLFGRKRGDGFDGAGAGFFTEIDRGLRSNERAAGSFSRDKFLKGVFKEAKEEELATMSTEAQTAGFAREAFNTNASLMVELSRVDDDLKKQRIAQEELSKANETKGSDAALQNNIAKGLEINNDLMIQNIELQSQIAAQKIAVDNASIKLSEEQLRQLKAQNMAEALKNNGGP